MFRQFDLSARPLAIRCRPSTPTAHAELTEWLEERLAAIRDAGPSLIVRLAQLSQELSDGAIDDGWLIEIESIPGAALQAKPVEELLGELIGDMRVLGLTPALLSGSPSPSRAAVLAS
jgi:hypothetical protein